MPGTTPDAAAGDEAMDMRMVDELLRPGVQDRKHAGRAADVTPVAAKLDYGFRRRLHEQRVAALWLERNASRRTDGTVTVTWK